MFGGLSEVSLRLARLKTHVLLHVFFCMYVYLCFSMNICVFVWVLLWRCIFGVCVSICFEYVCLYVFVLVSIVCLFVYVDECVQNVFDGHILRED